MKSGKAWLGLLISAFFLYLAFRQSDWARIWRSSKDADPLWVAAGLPVILLMFFIRALRWRYLLMPAGRLRLHSLFGAVMIGFMSLNLLPLRLGEIIRAYVLGRRENLSKTGVFATVVVERIFDGFSLLLLMVATLFIMPFDLGPDIKAWIRAFTYMAVTVYIFAATFCLLVRLKIDWVTWLVDKVFGRTPRLRQLLGDMIRSFAAGLDSVTDLRLLLTIALLSILLWIVTAGYYWVVMCAYRDAAGANIGLQVGYFGSAFVLVAIALGIMIPSSPGFVGVFEWACITALAALGVERSIAESYALVVHAAQFIPVTLLGIVYLYIYNFSFREIRSGARED